jgi:transcriptional regulator with XRE-family HTH domain
MRFATLRKILGFTQREIANAIGITQQSWAELEKQTKEMKKKTTLEVLKFRFGINPDWLLGKSHSLFYDWEKGLEIVRDKAFQVNPQLSKWELLFLTEVMHYVWSMPFVSKTSMETRVEFVKALVDSIRYFLFRCEIKNIESFTLSPTLSQFGRDLLDVLEKVQKFPPTIQLARELASVLFALLRDGDFDMTEDDEKTLSSFLLPWGYFVGLSYKTIKHDLIPLSSVYFSSLEELVKLEGKPFKKLELIFTQRLVYIEFRWNKLDLLFKDKLKVTLDVSEAFPFFVMLRKANEDMGFSVLSFNIFHDEFANFINLTLDRTTIMLKKEEFEGLLEVAEKVEKNKGLWLYLQKACLEQYGFV